MAACEWCGYGLQPGQAIHADCARRRIAELEAAVGRLWDVAATVGHDGVRGCFVPEAEWRRMMAVHPALSDRQKR